MSQKKGKFNCLRKMDRYADPINITFNQDKKFQTPSGGCLTIISILVVFTWFLVQVSNTVLASYSSSISTHQLGFVDG